MIDEFFHLYALVHMVTLQFRSNLYGKSSWTKIDFSLISEIHFVIIEIEFLILENEFLEILFSNIEK